MEKEKYIFTNYRSTEYPTDPVFKVGEKEFVVYGNPFGIERGPDLFEVYLPNKRIRYCLVRPHEVIKNEELLLKIKRYLLINDEQNNHSDLVNTYFIGDMEKTMDVSKTFTNQNTILVTYEMIEQWYPETPYDIFPIIIQHILKNQKYLGEHQFFFRLSDDIVFADPTLSDVEKRNYKLYLLNCMVNEGLAMYVQNGISIDCFDLTAKAVSSVQNKAPQQNKIAFIALKFDGNEERINAIQNAIAEAGFRPLVMNRYETNNWIMPEIFHNIEESRFVVADFSLKCDGAYYEAGYAAALSKPVIHLFDKREERDDNKLHFDIAQKSTIFYKDFDDLKKRLIDRIKATIK